MLSKKIGFRRLRKKRSNVWRKIDLINIIGRVIDIISSVRVSKIIVFASLFAISIHSCNRFYDFEKFTYVKLRNLEVKGGT